MSEVLERLKAEGNDVDAAMARFMNNEDMYIKFLGKLADDASYAGLLAALDAGDAEAGFHAAHTLKGLFGNLGLTRLVELNDPLVEMMRTGTPVPPDAPEVQALIDEYAVTLDIIQG